MDTKFQQDTVGCFNYVIDTHRAETRPYRSKPAERLHVSFFG